MSTQITSDGLRKVNNYSLVSLEGHAINGICIAETELLPLFSTEVKIIPSILNKAHSTEMKTSQTQTQLLQLTAI